MDIFLIVVGTILVIIVQFMFACEFENIATAKGYPEKKYFRYCFLFPIFGYLLVIALPNKEQTKESNQITNKEDE